RGGPGPRAPGDGEGAGAVGGAQAHLAGRRRDAGEGRDAGAVSDEYEITAGRPPAGDLAQRGELLGLVCAIVEQVAERRPRLCLAEGEPRGLEAAAPRAREHAADGNRALAEGGADAPPLLAAGVGEIALRRAVVEAEAGRIADAGRRDRVTHENDLGAAAQQLPHRVVGERGGRRDEDEHREQKDSHWSVALGAMGSVGRRQLLHGATAAATLAALPRAAMAHAAAAFVQSLEPAQRQAATFPLAHEERRNWHYIPKSRSGVAFKDMSPAARAAAHELMKAALSGAGYAKAVNVVKLEEVLRQLETFGGFLRDPEKYYVSVFGAPEVMTSWGWRLEGHHLSFNFTLVPGRPVSVTPAFFGANPAEVPSGPHRGLRALAEEQDLAFAVARGVDASLRGRLVIAAESPGDIVSGPGRADSLKTPAGRPPRHL